MATNESTPQNAPKRSSASRVFLSFLGLVVVLYSIILGYSVMTPKRVTASQSFMERCRRICESYGLVPTGEIDEDARALLEVLGNEKTESEQLADIVAANGFQPAITQPHELLSKPAPEFALKDVGGDAVQLRELTKRGPVVVVFYYGYMCSHCVAQLFALNDDIQQFESLGATVVAISSDTAAETREKYVEYGRFDFPVLSDRGNKVAEKFGVYTPESDGQKEELVHGTFVVAESGKVIWAYEGETPFVDNKTLLHIVGKLKEYTDKGLVPPCCRVPSRSKLLTGE
jgi:peroxiredoxin